MTAAVAVRLSAAAARDSDLLRGGRKLMAARAVVMFAGGDRPGSIGAALMAAGACVESGDMAGLAACEEILEGIAEDGTSREDKRRLN